MSRETIKDLVRLLGYVAKHTKDKWVKDYIEFQLTGSKQCFQGDDPEDEDKVFLLDLAERLWNVPAEYGTDQGDIERLKEVACRLPSYFVLEGLDSLSGFGVANTPNTQCDWVLTAVDKNGNGWVKFGNDKWRRT